MIKRVAVLIMILILSLSSPAIAAEAGGGIIEGRLVNGTDGGSSVANQDVILRIYQDGNEINSVTTKTDAEGRFVFDGLKTGSGYSYQAALTYQEADYSGDRLSFDDGETTKFTEVTVYDSTTSDEAIKVELAHTVIYVEEGSLQVMEVYTFVNEADRTYVGSRVATADGDKETLRFSLPEGATELQPIHGLMDCCIYGSEDGFIDTMPVLPGVRVVTYSYRVSYSSGAYTFSRKVDYPTDSYNLLVQGEETTVSSSQLSAEGLADIEGILFNYLSAEALAPGDTLVTQLAGLPQTENQGIVILWVVLTLAVLSAGFGFSYLKRKKRLQPLSPVESLERRQQRLLVELAQLDDDFEAGKIREGNYRRLRSVKKAQLVELIQRQKKKSVTR